MRVYSLQIIGWNVPERGGIFHLHDRRFHLMSRDGGNIVLYHPRVEFFHHFHLQCMEGATTHSRLRAAVSEWVPKYWTVSGYVHAHFCPLFNGLLFGWTLWIYLPNLSVALPIVRDNRGIQNVGQSLAMPTLPIPPKNPIGLPYIQIISLLAHVCTKFYIGVLDRGCEPPILGKRRP